MKSTKTSLLRIFQQSFRSTVSESDPSRREFVKQSVLGAGAALVGSAWLESFSVSKPRIVILGAGVAGLHSALILKDMGIDFSIFEASKRAGGRMYSQKDLMGEGIVTELGAEFIDSTHADILQLAKRFQLPLLDTEQDIPLEKYVFYFEGKKFTCKDLIEALSPFATSVQNDIDSLPEMIRYNDYGNAKKWDQISIIDYCKSKGMQGWLLALIDVAFTTEYGLDASEQSAINMLFLLNTHLPGCSLFGDSDERYKIVGGNQRITDAMAHAVGEIHYKFEVKIIEDSGGGYRIHFTNGEKVEADYIICTIPFSILRNIELKLKDLSPHKKQCIVELGYGRNAKSFIGYNKSLWRSQGYLGAVFSDTNVQLGWDHSHKQNTKTFGYTVFTGGTESDKMKEVSLDQKIRMYANHVEAVFPGTKNEQNEKQGQFYWPSYPFVKASYACYKVGQWTTIAGVESEPIGNIFFAGEHCSFDFQGFMNGGAETGRVAVEQLLHRLKK